MLDVVALLTDLPETRLARGQVGTVVERLDGEHSLIEFCDPQGKAYAIERCADSDLLILRYQSAPT